MHTIWAHPPLPAARYPLRSSGGRCETAGFASYRARIRRVQYSGQVADLLRYPRHRGKKRSTTSTDPARRLGSAAMIAGVALLASGCVHDARTPPRAPTFVPQRDAQAVIDLDARQCRSELDRHRIRYKPARLSKSGIVFPVRLLGELSGVRFSMAWSKNEATDRHAIWDCRMLLAMLPLARWLYDRDIVEVRYFSVYRHGGRRNSQHRKALAFDLLGVRARGETELASVQGHYPKGLIEHCRVRAWDDPRSYAELYAGIVCFAWRHRLFHTVLTPDHDRAHHDHLHLDIKARQRRPTQPYVVVASGVLPTPPDPPRV